MNTIWAKPPDIVAFTGGALAREAGFAPFDQATMPEGLRLEDVVTREGFARDPRTGQRFLQPAPARIDAAPAERGA